MRMRLIFRMLILAALIAAPSLLFAGMLSKAINEWKPVTVSGSIMSAERSLIIVNEKRVMLINDMIGSRKFVTSVMDIDGNDIGSGSLLARKFVLVKGSYVFDDALKSDVIVAKEIYVLPKAMTPKEINENFRLAVITEEW